MKSKALFLVVAVTLVLSTFGATAFTQTQSTDLANQNNRLSLSVPMQDQTPEQFEQDSLAGRTLPVWSYWVVSRADNLLYRGIVVGNAPGARGPDADGGTTLPVYIVPLVFTIYDTTNKRWVTFDPTKPDPNCSPNGSAVALTLASPLFNDSPMIWGPTNLGNTQYIDAQLRGEFWGWAQNAALPWHNKFRAFTVPAIPLWFNGPGGGVQNAPCGKYGTVNRAWFDWFVKVRLMPQLRAQGIGPTVIPFFLTYNVGFNDTVGYHNAYGSPTQTYAVSPFDTTQKWRNVHDITVIAHELGELVNDPTGFNFTPAWGHIGQVQNGCQNNFEVGDPLSDPNNVRVINIPLNGYNYHPQELAFWSWFFRPWFNLGVNGWYSSNNSLNTDAGPVCH